MAFCSGWMGGINSVALHPFTFPPLKLINIAHINGIVEFLLLEISLRAEFGLGRARANRNQNKIMTLG